MPLNEMMDRMSSVEVSLWAAEFRLRAAEREHQRKVAESRRRR